jgi:hypothetical protein
MSNDSMWRRLPARRRGEVQSGRSSTRSSCYGTAALGRRPRGAPTVSGGTCTEVKVRRSPALMRKQKVCDSVCSPVETAGELEAATARPALGKMVELR